MVATKSDSGSTFWPGKFPMLRGPWLGQSEPGREPVEFCPEILATGRASFGTAFSPAGDELFFATEDPKDSRLPQLAWMRLVDGLWTKPERAPFNSAHKDNDICMAPDGGRVLWRSWRPLPGEIEPQQRSALWASDRTAHGWGEAFPIECDGAIQYGGYPSLARSGAAYYAARIDETEIGVVRAQRAGAQYTSRETILTGLNRGGDVGVAPDESFLVVSRWYLPESNGESDLHISFQSADGTWTPLRNLGAPINNPLNENCPCVSPDGCWFFFFRYDPSANDFRTYWVDAAILDDLRP